MNRSLFVPHDAIQRNSNDSQFDDMRMMKLAEILDLTSNFANDIERLDLLPIQYFHGNLPRSRLVYANFHFTKRSRTERFLQYVMTDFYLALATSVAR